MLTMQLGVDVRHMNIAYAVCFTKPTPLVIFSAKCQAYEAIRLVPQRLMSHRLFYSSRTSYQGFIE